MLRKTIPQGKQGLTIYLPKKWADRKGLKPGDDVDITESDDAIIVTAKQANTPKQTKIAIKNLSESSIRTLLTNAYRKGYDAIIVEYENKQQLAICQQVIATRLIGFEIIRSGDGFFEADNVTEPAYDQFETILLKVVYSFDEILDEVGKAFAAVKAKKPFDLLVFDEMQQRVQRYDNFCRRAISKQSLGKQSSIYLWSFLGALVHAVREFHHLMKFLAASAGSKPALTISPQTEELLKQARRAYQLVRQAYLKKEIAPLAEVHQLHKDVVLKKGYELLSKTSGKEAILVYHMLACIRQLYLSNSSLNGLLA